MRAATMPMRIAALAVTSPDRRRIEFRIQRRLLTPNQFLGMHWRTKARERVDWQTHLANALIDAVGVPVAQELLGPLSGLPGARAVCEVKRRIAVMRWAPTRAGFIKDDDNLRFAVKPLHDAIKRLGLIRDDARTWLEAPTPTQEVSTDKTWWTWIVVTDAEAPRG